MLLPDDIVKVLKVVYQDLHGPYRTDDAPEVPTDIWAPKVPVVFRWSRGPAGQSVALTTQDHEFRIKVDSVAKPTGRFEGPASWLRDTSSDPYRLKTTHDGAIMKVLEQQYPLVPRGPGEPLGPEEIRQGWTLNLNATAVQRVRRVGLVANSNRLLYHDRLPRALLVRGSGCWVAGTDRALLVAAKIATVEQEDDHRDGSVWLPGNDAEVFLQVIEGAEMVPLVTTTTSGYINTMVSTRQRYGRWRYRRDPLDRVLQHLDKMLEPPDLQEQPGLLYDIQWAWDQHDARWPMALGGVPDLGANYSVCFHDTGDITQVIAAVPQDPEGKTVKLVGRSIATPSTTLPRDTWYSAERLLFGLKTAGPGAQWSCGALDNITDHFPVLYCKTKGVRVVLAAQRNPDADEMLAGKTTP